MRKAPWPDFAGHPIHEGDVIRHPSGERGTVIYRPNLPCLDENDAWRVDYHDGEPVSRLGLQLGDRGQAVVERGAGQ